jgi:flagellin-like protein
MKNFRRSRKALSPVVASIILIAVTVAVSIAVAAWMGALTIGFMGTEELKITSMTFGTGTSPDQFITISASNTGTNSITISSVTVTPVPTGTLAVTYPTGFTTTTSGVLNANTAGTIKVDLATGGLYVNGGSYKVTILTAKGNSFSYTGNAPS